jgi:hypothetical protein
MKEAFWKVFYWGLGILLALQIFLGVYSLFWPQVTGTIVSTSISEHKSWSSHNRLFGQRYWLPELDYSYSVNHKNYRGTRYNYDLLALLHSPFLNTKEAATKVVQQYPAAGNVEVYYCPSSPEFCCLSRGMYWYTLLGLLFVTFFYIRLIYRYCINRNADYD